MSLYTYVPGVAELLDLMLDTVYANMARTDLSNKPWRIRVEAIAEENRRSYERHPWGDDLRQPPAAGGPGLMASTSANSDATGTEWNGPERRTGRASRAAVSATVAKGGTVVRRPRIFAILFTIVTTAAVSLVTAVPASADDHTVGVQSRASLLCLQPLDESLDAGAPIVQVRCNNRRTQTWFFEDMGDHVFRPQNLASGLCLDALGGATNGTPVVQWPCSGISNQRWRASRDLPDIVSLRSRVAGTSSHCLDVPGGQSTDGLAVQIYVCNGTAAQAWGVGITTIIQP
jgi:hypothetical protein